MTKPRTRSKLLFAVVIGAIMLIASFLGLSTVFTARGADEDAALYYFFRSASAIAAEDNDTVYIADGETVYSYNTQYKSVEKLFDAAYQIKGMTYSDNKLLVIEDDTDGGISGLISAYDLSGARTAFDTTGAPSDGYTGVAARNGTLYAVRGTKFIYPFDIDGGAFSGEPITVNQTDKIFGLTCGTNNNNELLIALEDNITRNLDIYRRSKTGETEQIVTVGKETFLAMAHLRSGNYFSVITSQNRYIYDVSAYSEISNAAHTSDIKHITADRTNFYAFDGKQSVSVFSAEDIDIKTLLASRSRLNGFYDTPMGAASRKNRLFVADMLNRRISVKNGDGYSYIESITSPRAVATDTDGFLYVAHDRSRISKYDLSGNTETLIGTVHFKPAGVSNLLISGLTADSNGVLYALTDNGDLYKLDDNKYFSEEPTVGTEAFTPVVLNGEHNVLAVKAGLNRPALFAALRTPSGAEIVKAVDGAAEATGISGIQGFTDFAVDADGSVYVLNNDGGVNSVTRYDYDETDGTFSINPFIYTVPDDVGAAPDKISVSAIDETVGAAASDNSALRYRDVIITDSGRHTMSYIKCEQFDNVSYEPKIPPAFDNTPNPDISQSRRIIRSLSASAPLYAGANDVYPIRQIPKNAEILEDVILPEGYRVIVENYDPSSDYSKIVADNRDYEGGKLFIGYVRNKFLSEPFGYTDAPDETCVAVFESGVSVYKYPSIQTAESLASKPIGARFEFLDFVKLINPPADETAAAPLTTAIETEMLFGYTDNLGYEWYRVAFTDSDGKTFEGFILRDLVGPEAGIPITGIETNARIIAEFSGQLYAPVYTKDPVSGKLAVDPYFGDGLAIGVKVRVMDRATDASKEFTRIQFNFGTDNPGFFEAYVKTPNIKYEGVDAVKIIILLVLIITVIISIILTVRHFRQTPSK